MMPMMTDGVPCNKSVRKLTVFAKRFLSFSARNAPHNIPIGTANTTAIPNIIIVPMMPLAMPPGMGSPASMAFIALYAVGVGSVKNDHVSWS